MKKLLVLLILLAANIANAQWSPFMEFTVDPWKTTFYNTDYEEEQSLIKEISFGTRYKVAKFISVKAGVSILASRNSSSEPFFQDYFIAGSSPAFYNATLRHSASLESYSAFIGPQFDLGRFHLGANVHYAYGRFKDQNVRALEYVSFGGITKEHFFDIDYKDLQFFRTDVHFSVDILRAKKGSISLMVKYIKDYSQNEKVEVLDYDPEIVEMMSYNLGVED